MQLYAFYLAALILLNVILLLYSHRSKVHIHTDAAAEEETRLLPDPNTGNATRFKMTYFGVYIFATAADWLQGPYIYTHYRHSLALSEATVAALFTTGFVSAGFTAIFAGSLADRFGRRLACLSFCFIYALSCCSVLSHDLALLYVGRVLGGASATLLYSVFEAWMIAAYKAQNLQKQIRLDEMFSLGVVLSSSVAIVSGVVGQAIVSYFETSAAPFMLSVICLALAGLGIVCFWAEHYGDLTTSNDDRSKISWLKLENFSGHVMTLGFATTIFEGVMYTFVFLWTSTLTSRHVTSPEEATQLPLGLVFSCFMCATMSGSTLVPLVLPKGQSGARVLIWTFVLASVALLLPAVFHREEITFWSFVLFEACVGLYFPTMSKLKGDLIGEAARAQVYGLLRLPLNVYVMISLGASSRESNRNLVLSASSIQLLAAVFVIRKFLA